MRDKEAVRKKKKKTSSLLNVQNAKGHCAFWDTTTHVGLVDQTVSVLH